MAARRPVVTADTPAVREQLADGRSAAARAARRPRRARRRAAAPGRRPGPARADRRRRPRALARPRRPPRGRLRAARRPAAPNLPRRERLHRSPPTTGATRPRLFGPRHDFREALVLRRLLPALPGPAVLNAGAGAGSLTLKMVDAGLSVTSVDASVRLCDWTRAALERAGRAGRRTRSSRATCSASTCRTRRSTRPSARRCWSTWTTTPPPCASWRGCCGPAASWWSRSRPTRTATTGPTSGRVTGAATRSRCSRSGCGTPGSPTPGPTGWGFPLTGLYHRQVYRRALAPPAGRRAAAGTNVGAPPRLAARVVRAALELDTAFVGRRPGYHGLLAVAHRRADAGLSAAAAPASPLRRWGGLAAGLLVLGFLGWALVDGWQAVSEYDWDLDPWLLGLACLVLAVFYVMSGLGYAAIQDEHAPSGPPAAGDAGDLGQVAARPLRPRQRPDAARAGGARLRATASPAG